MPAPDLTDRGPYATAEDPDTAAQSGITVDRLRRDRAAEDVARPILRTSTAAALDILDAAVFSGDEFVDPAARATLRDGLARLERGLAGYDPAPKPKPLGSFPSALLNIGCAPTDRIHGSYTLDKPDVGVECGRLGLNHAFIADRQSATERTLVLRVSKPTGNLYPSELFALAARLKQDCIAVQPVDSLGRLAGPGFLTGPFAEFWGEFDPEQFFTS